MARPERNSVRARTKMRNRARFPREHSHAAFVGVSFGANSSQHLLYFPPRILNRFFTSNFTPFAQMRGSMWTGGTSISSLESTCCE